MDKVKLTPRLLAAARLAGESRFAVDVGTDHGRLAVWLLQNEMAARVAATDIRKGPLSSAVATAEEYGLAERIRFELCDGLDFPGAEEADTVVIAGMGGETIEGILRRAPWTLSGTHLVLQPQTKVDELCVWLRVTGYAIDNAVLAAEGERLYVIISARAGNKGALFAEDALAAAGDPLLQRWLDARIASVQRAIDGIESSEKKRRDTFELRQTLKRLLELRKEP